MRCIRRLVGSSIPPERRLRALLLQAFYTIRSERQLVERIEFDLLFRWFVVLGWMIRCGMRPPSPRTVTGCWRVNWGQVPRRRSGAAAGEGAAVERALFGGRHAAGGLGKHQSFRPKDGSGPPPDGGRNSEQDFHGEKRSNETHASTADPDARLYRKGRGKEAKPCFMGHALTEDRNGLIVGATATRASSHAERLAAECLLAPHADRAQRVTVGADRR